jgi:hypothetical protein
MGRLVLGLLFALWTIAAVAAESEQDAVRLTLDLLSIQPVYARGENPNPRVTSHRFIAGVELTNLAIAPSDAFVTGGTAHGAMAEPKKDAGWAAHSGWQTISSDNRPSLSALLRFGSPGKELKIRPRRHSISIEYIQDFD